MHSKGRITLQQLPRHPKRGGYTQFVHVRSRMAIDPRTPTMLGWRTSGVHRPGARGGYSYVAFFNHLTFDHAHPSGRSHAERRAEIRR